MNSDEQAVQHRRRWQLSAGLEPTCSTTAGVLAAGLEVASWSCCRPIGHTGAHETHLDPDLPPRARDGDLLSGPTGLPVSALIRWDNDGSGLEP